MKSPPTRKRGRPPAGTQGAPEAFDLIKDFLHRQGLTENGFAVKYRMVPSSVFRALSSRKEAAWTETFQRIYRIAVNESESPPDVDVTRLAKYKGPGEQIVKRLLGDIDDLVRTLSQDL